MEGCRGCSLLASLLADRTEEAECSEEILRHLRERVAHLEADGQWRRVIKDAGG
jgi:hypothetical protein